MINSESYQLLYILFKCHLLSFVITVNYLSLSFVNNLIWHKVNRLFTPLVGCHARSLFQADAPQPRWEEMVDRFWQYVSELNTHANGVVLNIKESQISRELE